MNPPDPIAEAPASAVALAPLLEHRERFLQFVRARIADPALAEDIVQDGFLKALRADSVPGADGDLTAWFYRVLRHAVIDAYRRRGVREPLSEAWPENWEPAAHTEEQRRLCACFQPLLPTLRPEYASLIEELDLKQTPPEQLAAALGVTPNNLRVRHHRARAQLRERLEQSCRACGQHGCLDCHCGESGHPH